MLPALMSAFSGRTSSTFRRRPSSRPRTRRKSRCEPHQRALPFSGQTSARSSSLEDAADTFGTRLRGRCGNRPVSRFSSALLDKDVRRINQSWPAWTCG